jgi:flagellar hook assembly protein FlgD
MNARKEGKPLTPKQVIEKAQELSQTFRLTTREQIDAATARIKAEAGKTVKPTPQKAEPAKAKTRLKWNPAKGDFE